MNACAKLLLAALLPSLSVESKCAVAPVIHALPLAPSRSPLEFAQNRQPVQVKDANSGAAAESAGKRDHWAFKAPVRPPEPKVKNKKWVRNPIDSFVLAR